MADSRISISFTNPDCNQAVVSSTEPQDGVFNRLYYIIIADQETGQYMAHGATFGATSVTFNVLPANRILSVYTPLNPSVPSSISTPTATAKLASILAGTTPANEYTFRHFLVSCKYQKGLVDKNTQDATQIQNEGCDKYEYAFLKGLYISANYLISGDMPSKASPILDTLDVELAKCDCEDCGCS